MPGITPSPYGHTEARVNTGLLSSLRRLFSTAVDLLFPPRCAGCGRVDAFWCTSCQEELDQIPIQLFSKSIDPLQNVVATAVHQGKIQVAIHGLKYENTPQLAQPLGKRLSDCLLRLNWTIDIIVPVPLHTKRLAERGYNQSQILAEVVAAQTGLSCTPQAVQRQRETRSQVEVGTREQRLINVADAFLADPRLVGQKKILLVDDVCTTGATLSACAQAALEAGAAAVYALTIATPS
jgi:ComF family protein